MVSREKMFEEAVERMERLGIKADDIERFKDRNRVVKVLVNHEKHSVWYDEMTPEEDEMIKKFEEADHVVYYLIQDEGLWPDGCKFPRYTMLYVDGYDEEYEMVKEDSIDACGAVPAYIINIDEPDCSEITEISFRNVGGMIINLS